MKNVAVQNVYFCHETCSLVGDIDPRVWNFFFGCSDLSKNPLTPSVFLCKRTLCVLFTDLLTDDLLKIVRGNYFPCYFIRIRNIKYKYWIYWFVRFYFFSSFWFSFCVHFHMQLQLLSDSRVSTAVYLSSSNPHVISSLSLVSEQC